MRRPGNGIGDETSSPFRQDSCFHDSTDLPTIKVGRRE
jgi:hypothetical protein